ncbi:MAG: GxxExxY protein [Fimbriimonadaceae bacterium]|nr:GxxExxY protein [Fimbriimonadaceae bacterium]
MHINELSGIIVDAAFKVHTALGPGLLESVYEAALEHELASRGLKVKRQRPIPVIYEGTKLAVGFRADLIVNDIIIVEIKSLDLVPPVAYKTLLTYLRLTNISLGLLINFNVDLIKDGIRRVANNVED